jgi:hypothetical protein
MSVLDAGLMESDSNQKNPTVKRRHGRVRCQDIACTLGEIQDISASGMRVKVKHVKAEQGMIVSVGLEGLDGPMLLDCRVVWARRTGFFGREVGLAFEHLTDADRKQLSLMGRAAAYNETVREDIERFRKAS